MAAPYGWMMQCRLFGFGLRNHFFQGLVGPVPWPYLCYPTYSLGILHWKVACERPVGWGLRSQTVEASWQHDGWQICCCGIQRRLEPSTIYLTQTWFVFLIPVEFQISLFVYLHLFITYPSIQPEHPLPIVMVASGPVFRKYINLWPLGKLV